MKYRRMIWASSMISVRKERKARRNVAGKSEGQRQLGKIDQEGRVVLKLILREIG